MPRQITPDLESLRGKSIVDLCPQGFHDFEANHCAHFVSHAGGYALGYQCHRISGSSRKGVCVRVQELFPECPQVGKWSDLPQTDDDLLVFITARRNVNLTAKTIENVPRKHIGILRAGQIYHYSNTEDKVVKQTPEQVLTRFRSTYQDPTVDLFFGTLPGIARGLAKPLAATGGPVGDRRRRGVRGEDSGPLSMTLVREVFTDTSTIGELSLNGKFECYILEDQVRPEKIAGVTAIPAGTYAVVITHSPKFGRDLPLLLNVPNFEGIRIHPGNHAADTDGCLLPGKTKARDFVGDSRAAFKALFDKLAKAQQDGREMSIEISEAAVSRATSASSARSRSRKAAAPAYFRVLADPLAVRSSEDPLREDNVTGHLDFGQLVAVQRDGNREGWLAVKSATGDDEVAGFVQEQYLEAVPAPSPAPAAAAARGRKPAKGRQSATRGAQAAPKAPELYRVDEEFANLRTQAGVIESRTVIAALKRGQLVAKIGGSTKPLWWEVRAVVQGEDLTGFMNSTLLVAESALPDFPQDGISTPASGVQVSEQALQMILDFEGMDQPSKWPGNQSGISLGHGYDLGFQSPDQFQADWERHLTPEQMKRLAKALGKTGTAARNMAPQFADITIKRAAAGEVFTRSTLPKIKGWGAASFPGIARLHPDAQGALVSLVYNRGQAMEGERRREMREVRDAVASPTLTREDRLRRIAAAIRSMKRLWPDTLGLRRRRDAEAKLVEGTI